MSSKRIQLPSYNAGKQVGGGRNNGCLLARTADITVIVAQEALRSKAPLVEYIPYNCGFQGNTYIPQEVVLVPGRYIYRPGSHAHFLGNIYILQEVS